MKLDLGCGQRKRPGALGLDRRLTADVDIVADLNRAAIPLADSSVEEVYCFHLLEHMSDPRAVIEEIWRVLRPGGRAEIRVPHFSNHQGYDPGHRAFFSLSAFDVYDESTTIGRGAGYTTRARFRILEKRIVLFRKKLLPHTYLFAALARRRPELYERYFAFLAPARELVFVLQAVK